MICSIEVRYSFSRYTYGKGAKGRANVQLYFSVYGWNKKSTLAKDIPVSTKQYIVAQYMYNVNYTYYFKLIL